MSAREMLVEALEQLGYPVFNLNYTGTEETYFVYQVVAGVPEMYADDDNEYMFIVFRVNLYSKHPYTELLKQTVTALKQAGFTVANVDAEMYKEDTQFFHIPITINILEES